MDSNFQLPLAIDLAATILLGLTGGLTAIRRGYDFVGLSALAFVTGVGGGLIRDSMFINHGPPVIATDERYLYAVAIAALLARLLRTRIERFHHFIAHADALGLGAYAVVGAQKALLFGLSAPAAVLVGVVNAAGGGLLRDIISGEAPLVFKPGQFYVLAALFGSTVFVVIERQTAIPPVYAAAITIPVTFLLRALAIRFNWRTTPL